MAQTNSNHSLKNAFDSNQNQLINETRASCLTEAISGAQFFQAALLQ